MTYHTLAKCQAGGKIQEWMRCPLGFPPVYIPPSIQKASQAQEITSFKNFLLEFRETGVGASTVRREAWVFSVVPSRNHLPIKDSSDAECYFIGVTNCRYLLWLCLRVSGRLPEL